MLYEVITPFGRYRGSLPGSRPPAVLTQTCPGAATLQGPQFTPKPCGLCAFLAFDHGVLKRIIQLGGYGGQVGGLITIGTPHYGTPFTDIALGLV